MDLDTDTQTRWKSQRGVDGEAWKRSGKKMGATVAVGGLEKEEGEGGGEDDGAAQHGREGASTMRDQQFRPKGGRSLTKTTLWTPPFLTASLRDKMHKTSRHSVR